MTFSYFAGGWGPRVCLLSLILNFAASFTADAAPKHRPLSEERWVTYKNERYGFSIYYPSALFKAQPPSENGDGRIFVTDDGNAKIVVYGARNDENFSIKEYRETILSEFGGYDQLDYSPVGQSWFVLSGYRGETIYYQKVMFSCGNSIITALSITFPTADKPLYEGLVETMEDSFKTGRGTDTPPKC